MKTTTPADGPRLRSDAGFTILELLISVSILMVVSGLMMRATTDMGRLGRQQTNDSDMHAGIRNATALLQQEVGQAGRAALPGNPVIPAVAAGNQWATVNPSVASIFTDERLVVGTGPAQEIVTVAEVNTGSNQFRAVFQNAHANAPIRPAGGFAEGVVPTNRANGSTGTVLKIVGDINDDGNLVYVEYTCNWGIGRLFRNMMPFNAASKPALTVEQVLLDNLLPNPPNPDGTPAPCFTYEQRTIGGTTYVINVAIMTTVRTHNRDPISGRFGTVTKALLNLAPRNVFHVWEVASLGYTNRIQPLPPTVINLLP